MTGLILCGGESSRMGTDKGMLISQGSNWAKSNANLFTALNLSFFVSINHMQKTNYGQVFEVKQLITDNPAINVRGPLLGLLSFHKIFPNENILVLACDMIEMKLPPLELLLEKYSKYIGFEVYLFKTGNTFQPLCAIYTSAFLSNTLNKLSIGDLKRFSLTALIDGSKYFVVEASPEWLNYFNNYNSPADLINLKIEQS